VRKFTLFINQDGIFEICQKGFEFKKSDEALFDRYLFADIATDGGKVAYIYDVSLHDEQMSKAARDPLMLEICEFEIIIARRERENRQMSLYEALRLVWQIKYGG